MAETPTLRRRLAALAVFAVASGALIATSPARIQSSLEASHSGTAELTFAVPRVSGTVLLDLSAAALPAAGDRRLRVSGTVNFNDSDSDDEVHMSVRSVEVDAAPLESDGSTTWPIEQLCRVAEPCQRAFEVTLEWLHPEAGASRRGAFRAMSRIEYEQVETNPEGASARWSITSDFAPAPGGPLVSAETGQERLTLDREHPAALRHVVLTASGIAEAARSVAFVRSSLTEPAVRFTIVPDDGGPDAATDAAAVDPFVDCPETGVCETGVTVLIELDAVEPASSATVDWSLQAQAEFPEAKVPSADARLSAVVDQAVDVDSDTTAISTHASGRLEPGPEEVGTLGSFARIVISLEDAALRQEWTDSAFRPPAVGLLSVRATDDATIGLHVAGDEGTTYAYPSLTLGPTRLPGAVLVYPFATCDPGADCTVALWLSATTATPASAASPSTVTVDWDLDLDVYYPGATPPLGAQVQIDVTVDDP